MSGDKTLITLAASWDWQLACTGN